RVKSRVVRSLLTVLAVGGCAGALLVGQHFRWGLRAGADSHSAAATGAQAARPRKVDERTLAGPATVARTLGLLTGEVAASSPTRDMAPLNGVLALDTNRLASIHTRFAGEVVALGTAQGGETQTPDRDASAERPLRPGDIVKKGQLLAVVWSKEL